MLNKTRVKERILLISNFYNELQKLATLSKDDFFSDSRNYAAAESYLRRSLEAIFDIGRHILAKTGQVEMSLEYKAIAQGLKDNKIISSNLGEHLIKMAGYRNRLVHLYHQVSKEELYKIICDDLSDFKNFILEIDEYLQED